MLSFVLSNIRVSLGIILFLFGIYYVISTLSIVCMLVFTNVRTRHSLSASALANGLSVIFSTIIIALAFEALTLSGTFIFAGSNILFQSFLLWYIYNLQLKNFLLPLVVGNSLAYWLVFPNMIKLMQL